MGYEVDAKVANEVAGYLESFRSQLNNPDEPFVLLARFEVKEGTETDCEGAFAQWQLETRKEQGCRAFELHRQADSRTRFVVYERWESLADLENHLLKSHTTELRHLVESILAGIPEFNVLIPTHAENE